MGRPKKDAVVLNIRMSRPVMEQLEKHCAAAGQTKTMAVERILSGYFEAQQKSKKTK